MSRPTIEATAMRIAISADHRGYNSVKLLCEKLTREGNQVEMLGDCANGSADYPERAYLVGREVASGKAEAGILICGSGIGMSIAANKVHGVRAAVVHDEITATLSRSHNNANVLCLSADLLGQRLIETIVETWLKTPFEGGRHQRRVRKIAAIEQGVDPATIGDGD